MSATPVTEAVASAKGVDVDTDPFDMIPPNYDGRAAALCLHGLTGTPYEMRPIAEALLARGIRCVGPVMAGHGSTAAVLVKTSHRDWVDLARIELAKLRTSCQHVYVAGLSLGGLVTLALAAENLADAIAVLATPLRMALPIRLAIPLAKHVAPILKLKGETDIRNAEARARHPSFDAFPLASVHEAMKLQKIVRRGLPRITAPTFVGHGALDQLCGPNNAREIFSEVNASKRTLHIGHRSGHVISVDHDGPALSKAIADFFTQ